MKCVENQARRKMPAGRRASNRGAKICKLGDHACMPGGSSPAWGHYQSRRRPLCPAKMGDLASARVGRTEVSATDFIPCSRQTGGCWRKVSLRRQRHRAEVLSRARRAPSAAPQSGGAAAGARARAQTRRQPLARRSRHACAAGRAPLRRRPAPAPGEPAPRPSASRGGAGQLCGVSNSLPQMARAAPDWAWWRTGNKAHSSAHWCVQPTQTWPRFPQGKAHSRHQAHPELRAQRHR